MKTLLSKANTGEDMLKVLEALTSDAVDDTQEGQYGTLGDIEFWWVDNIGGQNLMSFVYHWVVTVVYTEGAICPLSDITVIRVLCEFMNVGVAGGLNFFQLF